MIASRLTFPGLLLLVWLPALAQDSGPGQSQHGQQQEQQILPYQCEKWQSRVKALSDSNDPLEQQLGELLAEPNAQFCQVQRVRVSAPEKDRESWFDFDLNLAGIAGLLRLLAISALVLLLLWLAWRWRPESFRSPSTRHTGPSLPTDFRRRLAADIAPLPANIAAAAEQAWNDGQPRLAMSLLYRGTIARLLPRQLHSEARTEAEVLAEIRSASHPAPLIGFVARLTRLWQQTAWASQPPKTDDFSALRLEWQNHFERLDNPAS